MTERISDPDLIAHATMLEMKEKAAELRVQAADMERISLGLEREWNRWARVLHERYRLATDGTEGVTDDGRIIRSRPLRSEPAPTLPAGDDGEMVAERLKRALTPQPPRAGLDVAPVGRPGYGVRR